MKKLTTTLAVLTFIGTILKTGYGVTPEDTKAFCALTSGFCSSCQNLCSKNLTFLGKTRYSSGCGEYCDEVNGTITIIDLSDKGLTDLGTEIEAFTDLTRLDLSHNSLTSLPDSLCSLERLKELFLNDNGLESLPDDFGDIAGLNSLTLYNNSLRTLPESFGNLTKLTSLSLEGNPIETLPESFGNLRSLKSIQFDSEHRALKHLPKSFFNLDLSTLDVHNNQLTEVPEELGNLKNLYYLDLSHNNITGLPETLGSLSGLSYLDVSHNMISTLPDAFSSLTSLLFRDFIFDHNCLTTLPKSFGRWFENYTSSNYLDLSYQCFDEIPEIISEFSYVNGLNMSYNNVSHVAVASMGLSSLDLSHNDMRKIPEGLRQLSVDNLDLSFNKLTTIEGLPQNMTSLDLSNNFILEIPFDLKETLPAHLNLDYNYLECSKYENETWRPIESNCFWDRQYECSEKSIEECEEIKNEYGICSPNSNRDACLRYTNGVKEFCEFSQELGYWDCQDIYPDGPCNGTSKFYGFVYDCESDRVTEYRASNIRDYLTEIPDSAVNLTSLITLSITGLGLTEIPDSYEKFVHVKTLNLTGNKLTSIPEVAYSFEDLKNFDISYNRLQYLPEHFFMQTHLQLFHAHHNFIISVSYGTFAFLGDISDVNIDYNFIDCNKFYSVEVCKRYSQFDCGWINREECTLNTTGICSYSDSNLRCILHGRYTKTKDNLKSIIGPIFTVLVGLLAFGGALYLTIREKNIEKNKNNIKNKDVIRNELGPSAKPIPIPLSPVNKAPSYDPTLTPIIRSRMSIEYTFYDCFQQGLNSVQRLYKFKDYTLIKDIGKVLEYAGCNNSDVLLFSQKIVSWTRKVPCDPPLTLNDLEVLGLFTYNYGDDFKDKSPTYNLCHSMNTQTVSKICRQREFLFLTLSTLRKLPFTNFKDKKYYFAVSSIRLDSLNFTLKQMVKLMPFVTLYSSKDAVMSTLSGTYGVIFEVTAVEGYDITKYSATDPASFGIEEVVMEPESVFRVEWCMDVSPDIGEVSLMYIREESEFTLANVIKGAHY